MSPVGSDGLHVREVVDEDFGNHRRHGYERLIPNDFGVPVDVTAESATAPDDVDVEQVAGETRIRIGDRDRTITGQHRYVLEYTYPTTTLDEGTLALDVIGTDETLETERFEVVVTGLELEDPLCNVGGPGASGGCELVRDGDVYRAVIAPLEPGQGITIGGTVVGRLPVVDVPLPPEPEPQPNRRAALAAANAVLGTAAAAGVYAWARRRGRNEVFAGGAADAAFGVPLPPPVAAGRAEAGAVAMPSVRLVPDDRMDELATTEFVPPTGVDPWLGNVLLTERFSNDVDRRVVRRPRRRRGAGGQRGGLGRPTAPRPALRVGAGGGTSGPRSTLRQRPDRDARQVLTVVRIGVACRRGPPSATRSMPPGTGSVRSTAGAASGSGRSSRSPSS